jgi:hypothetical protein
LVTLWIPKEVFAPVFHAMAANPGVLKVIDYMNEWGLVLIGFRTCFRNIYAFGYLGGYVTPGILLLVSSAFCGVELRLAKRRKLFYCG